MNQRDFTIIANVVSGKIGVRMVPCNSGWAANLQKNIIFYPRYTYYRESDVGFLLHEAAHLRFSSIGHNMNKQMRAWVVNTGKSAEQIWTLVNALEDARIEHQLKQVYAGAQDFLDASYYDIVDVAMRTSRTMRWYEPEEYKKRKRRHWAHYAMYWVILYALDEAYAEDYLDAWGVGRKVRKAISKSKQLIANKLFVCKDTLELIDFISTELFPFYLPLCDEEEKQQKEDEEEFKEALKKALQQLIEQLKKMVQEHQEQLEQQRHQEEQANQQQGGANSPQNTSGEEQTEQPPEQGGRGETGRGEQPEAQQDGSNEDQDQESSSEQAGQGQGQQQSPQGSGQQQASQEELEAAEQLDRGGMGLKTGGMTEELAGKVDEQGEYVTTGGFVGGDLGGFGKMFYRPSISELNLEQLQEEVRRHLARVRKAVSILKDVETERFEGNYDSGKLQNRKLYKVGTNNVRVFTRRIAEVESDKNMAIALLVDESGSMYESVRSQTGESRRKCIDACVSAALLGRALEIANKPFGIYGFADGFRVRKSFTDRYQMARLLDIASQVGGGTQEDLGIREAAKELLQQRERNKVMIVINDGEPNDDRALAREIQKLDKQIKIYAIGIQSESVRRHYKRAVVVHDTAQLADELLRIFKENVGKRVR